MDVMYIHIFLNGYSSYTSDACKENPLNIPFIQ